MPFWIKPAGSGDNEPLQELRSVVSFRIDIEGEGAGSTYRRDAFAEHERVTKDLRTARERLFYRMRQTYRQPHLIEDCSDFSVSDVLDRGT